MFRNALGALAALTLVGGTVANAEMVELVDGQTSVVLDTATLSSAASLDLSSVSSDVIVPGSLADSVAFDINARDAVAPLLPTTAMYDTTDPLNTYSGTIEHAGSVFFNNDAVEVGNFTIAFDPARVGTLGGMASGFYVESTVGIAAILFDVKNPSSATFGSAELEIAADLLVSPEFAGFLVDQGLASADLSGADVGDALVEGRVVPEPTTALLALLGGLVALRRR